jgi:hypothetical protein
MVLGDLKPPEVGKELGKKLEAWNKMKNAKPKLICKCGDPSCKIGPFVRRA